MKTFSYSIKDAVGIHARPAGLLVKKAKEYKSTIMIRARGKEADATRLMALLSMGVKEGTEITVTIEGEDEAQAAEGIKAFLEANL